MEPTHEARMGYAIGMIATGGPEVSDKQLRAAQIFEEAQRPLTIIPDES